MTETGITKTDAASIIESVVIGGDLSKLTPEQRVGYYKSVCESLGLNPLTRPFDYITLNNKLTLYAKKDTTDQLRKRDSVSVTRLDQQIINDICIVTAYVSAGNRTDAATGAVSLKGLSGDALANAMMKAETKAKRRATLSICGLGILDETEIETIPQGKQTVVDFETGEVKSGVVKPMTAAQAMNDLGYDDEQPRPKPQTVSGAMTYEQACAVKGSKGESYGNLTDEELTGKRFGINKIVNDPNTDPEKQSAALNKLEAIKILLSVPESERLQRAGQPAMEFDQD